MDSKGQAQIFFRAMERESTRNDLVSAIHEMIEHEKLSPADLSYEVEEAIEQVAEAIGVEHPYVKVSIDFFGTATVEDNFPWEENSA